MNIHDVDKYPWLSQEKDFIWQCIQQKKKVLGICLGAQLIAQVLGAEVYSNRVKEIGWYYITWNSCARSHPVFNFLPCRQITFHWHSDTFRLPAGAVRLASSRYSKNQAFVYENHVVGLQFHLEMGREDLIQLIENNKEGLKEQGPHIQSAEHILDRPEHIKSSNITMIQFLDRFLTDAHKTVPEIKTAPEHY